MPHSLNLRFIPQVPALIDFDEGIEDIPADDKPSPDLQYGQLAPHDEQGCKTKGFASLAEGQTATVQIEDLKRRASRMVFIPIPVYLQASRTLKPALLKMVSSML